MRPICGCIGFACGALPTRAVGWVVSAPACAPCGCAGDPVLEGILCCGLLRWLWAGFTDVTEELVCAPAVGGRTRCKERDSELSICVCTLAWSVEVRRINRTVSCENTSLNVRFSWTNALPLYINRWRSGLGLLATLSQISYFSSPMVIAMGSTGKVILLGTSTEGDRTWSTIVWR